MPKDTKEMLANFDGVPNNTNTIQATVDANDRRKEHIAEMILARNPANRLV